MKRFTLVLFLLVLTAPLLLGQRPPAASRGFDPDKVFAAGPIDSINVFNGNVIATIPLGETYIVSPTLSYSFKAIHNGKTWDYARRPTQIPVTCPPGQQEGGCYALFTNMMAIPDGTANAGFGWRVQFARFILPGQSEANSDRVQLETPDGAQHGLYESLHDGDPFDGASYTRDGTYLRVRGTGVAGHIAVDTPDGVTYEFTDYQLTQMHDRVMDASGNYVNHVDIQYGPLVGDPAWPCSFPAISQKIIDSKGRTSYLCFQSMDSGDVSRPTVTDVYVDTLAGTGHYSFTHAQTTFARENYINAINPTFSPTTTAPAVTEITRPDGSSYAFEYLGTFAHPGTATGNFESITLPTGGSYHYEYGGYQIRSSYDCLTNADWEAIPPNPGVAKREERDSDGTVVGSTTYGQYDLSGGGGPYECTTEQEGPGPFQALAPDAELSNFVIPSDNRSKTVHYYSVWPGYNRLKIDSRDGFKPNEYGLPFTRNASKMRDGLFLSTETYLCTNAAAGNCSATPVRATYVQYEVDAYVNVNFDLHDHNPRMKRTATVYFDDVDPVSGLTKVTTSTVSNDDFDGFGHYRVSETTGFGTATKRRTLTNFNPTAGTFPGTHTLPPMTSPWLLNLFTYQETKELDAAGTTLSSAKTEVCFDSSTGFLKRSRVVAGGTISATRDLLAVYEANANGEVGAESYYGGDRFPLPSGFSTCSSTVSGPQYRITHQYASGVLKSSQYDGTTFKSYDVDVHPSTSAVTTSRDTAGIPTAYTYDALGRVTAIRPQGSVWTEYTYALPAGPTEHPSVTIRQRPEGSAATVPPITEQTYYFDGLGRLIQQKSAVTTNDWSTVHRTYDSMGRLTKEYVPHFSTSPNFTGMPSPPPPYTEYTYDQLGQNTVIKFPDGKETTTAYFGASQQRRTVNVATGTNQETPQTTAYIRDYLGRLTSVREKNNTVITAYSYDLGDRLSSVQIVGTEGTQTRTFDYDGRGFLRWESHPEAGMTSYTYDARGHVHTKTQSAALSLFDLTYEYDPAERLIEVRGRNPFFDSASPADPNQPQFRLLKQFAYATANETDNYRLGKLWAASRYNYDPSAPLGVAYKVTETYRYGDEAGRLNHRITSITHGVGADESTWESDRDILTEVEYNELSLPAIVKYPSCLDCGTSGGPEPVRHQPYGYSFARLASVPGYLDEVTYWPNGMWNAMKRSNGMTDTQTVDPSGMPRPVAFTSAPSTICSQATITSQPVGGTVTASNPVTLSVSVSGTGDFTYEWWNDNQLISVTTNTPASTATFTATLTNTPVTTRYRVFISNACGRIESVAATVSANSCAAPNSVSASAQPNADGTYTLSATAEGTEPRTYTWRRSSDQSLIGTTRTVTVGPLSATTTYTVSVANACSGTPATSDVTISIRTPMAAVLTAARVPNANQIRITWTGPTTGVSYTLQRRSGIEGWSTSVTMSAAALSAREYYDSNLIVAGRTYAYRLKNSSDLFSNSDVATTATFGSATAGGLTVTAAFDSTLAALNSVRAAVGWPPVTWTDILSSKDPLPAPGARIMSTHVLAARARMNEALQTLGVIANPYTPSDVRGVVIEARHLNDITERAY